MVDITWLIGFLASICITIAILPQTYKMWKMRHEVLEEFHILWFSFNIMGSFLFLWYGALIQQIGLIILNFVGAGSGVLMFMIYGGVWIKE
jgi:MtN3 and saliva related transmembrane protein